MGGARRAGLTVNVPLPAGATGDVVRRALDEVAAPVIDEFGPTWVLISAGFDAHRADPLADLALSSGDFADLARTVAGYAPRSRPGGGLLEGGYDLGALRSSVAATLGALSDAPIVGREHPTAGGPGVESVERAEAERAWPWTADTGTSWTHRAVTRGDVNGGTSALVQVSRQMPSRLSTPMVEENASTGPAAGRRRRGGGRWQLEPQPQQEPKPQSLACKRGRWRRCEWQRRSEWQRPSGSRLRRWEGQRGPVEPVRRWRWPVGA